jgi:hypothetical protein
MQVEGNHCSAAALHRKEDTMSIYMLGVIDGPSLAALQGSISRAHVSFDTDEGRFEAHIHVCDMLPDDAGVAVQGNITSGPYEGRSFVGTYDPHTHKGRLNLAAAP